MVSIADRALLLIGLGALLIVSEGFELEWLLGGTTAALSCSAVGWLRVRGVKSDSAAAPLLLSMRGAFQGSWPYALLFLLLMTYHRVDAIMLERMAPNGAVQTGWYAMGYRLFEAANMVGFLFATLLLPYFTHAECRGRRTATRSRGKPLAACRRWECSVGRCLFAQLFSASFMPLS